MAVCHHVKKKKRKMTNAIFEESIRSSDPNLRGSSLQATNPSLNGGKFSLPAQFDADKEDNWSIVRSKLYNSTYDRTCNISEVHPCSVLVAEN